MNFLLILYYFFQLVLLKTHVIFSYVQKQFYLRSIPITFLYEQPRKFRFRKPFKRKIYNSTKVLSSSSSGVGFGFYGLQALEAGRLKYKQIAAVRKAFLFFFKFASNLVLRLQFAAPVTSKSAGVRMGRGKGKISHWVANVKPGEVIFEVSKKVPSHMLPAVLRVIRERIPIHLRVINRKVI